MEQSAGVGQFWTPIMGVGGSLLHADQHISELESPGLNLFQGIPSQTQLNDKSSRIIEVTIMQTIFMPSKVISQESDIIL
jgi:hypothetical protein